ncbi:GA module-containing protein, partial [Weissella minor]|uniref:GA module-containing protein n=1 Tax=Weissella minor TaxID=1620 RepID=UPI001BAFB54F
MKERTTEIISKLQDLSDEEKNGYIERLDAITDATDENLQNMLEILNEAQLQNEANRVQKALEEAQEQAYKDIDQLDYLSNKPELKEQIKNAPNMDAVLQIVADAKVENEKLRQANELEKLKGSSIAEIDKLENLSKADKDAAKQIIMDATDAKTINDKVTDMKAQDSLVTGEKINANRQILEYDNMTIAQQNEFTKRISEATSVEDIQKIVAEAKALNDRLEKEALERLRTETIDYINGLGFVDKRVKDSLISAVKRAKTKDEILAQKKKADESNRAARDNTLDLAFETIDSLLNIDDDAKNAYKERVENAQTLDDLLDVPVAAEEEDYAILDAKRTEALEAIDQLKNIGNNYRQQMIDAIDSADFTGDIDDLIVEAQAEDARLLAEKKVTGQAEIDDMQFLTDAQKQDFNNRIIASDTIAEIDAILAEARALNVLREQQQIAKDGIDQLKNLDAAEKQAAKDAVDQATNQAGVDQAVTDANALDAKHLQDKKAEGNQIVDALKNVDAEYKQSIKNQIDASDFVGDIDALISEAQAEDARILAEKKDSGEFEIENLDHLTDAQKHDFNERINASDNIAEIAEILVEARQKNQANKDLQDAKDAAKKEVNGFPTLDDATKDAIKDALDKATSEEEVQNILDNAKEQENQAAKDLQDAKDAAKEEVNGFPTLDDATKDAIKDALDKATSEEEVQNILDNAKEQENQAAKDLQDAKDAAKEEVNGFPTLDDATKDAIKDALDKATSEEEVQNILDNAKEQENQAAKELQDAKDAAKEVVDGLDNLDDATKDAIKDA